MKYILYDFFEIYFYSGKILFLRLKIIYFEYVDYCFRLITILHIIINHGIGTSPKEV